MGIIQLDKFTIDKIAAGEVIERPSSVVKELVENSIDAGSGAITIEIKNGGIDLIRITDNGCGIEKDEVEKAFLRHATSKIKDATDLFDLNYLGFRGEALASICAISKVELITKTAMEMIGVRYVNEGGEIIQHEEIGAPEGTTFIIRDIFFNTPVRKKFLKSPQTEASYISAIVERLALSNPDISFKLIVNGNTKLHTFGNGNLKDVIYNIYGRDIAKNLYEVNFSLEHYSLTGYVGKPAITRGNRNFENYFINGRYVKNSIISKAIEDAYKPFIMQHKYPFTAMLFEIDGNYVDVNVHPSKLEVRFFEGSFLYDEIYKAISSSLTQKNLIPEVSFKNKEIREEKEFVKSPEPFEKNRISMIQKERKQNLDIIKEAEKNDKNILLEIGKELVNNNTQPYNFIKNSDNLDNNKIFNSDNVLTKEENKLFESTYDKPYVKVETDEVKVEKKENALDVELSNAVLDEKIIKAAKQEEIVDFLNENNNNDIEQAKLSTKGLVKIVGQIFQTYWIIQYKDEMLIIDQHAAHEKVLYEEMMKKYNNNEVMSSPLLIPEMLSLTSTEEEVLINNMDSFKELGYEIEPLGDREFAVKAVPFNLLGINTREMFFDILAGLSDEISPKDTSVLITEKLASMSCKAAVKGNTELSTMELTALFEKMLALDNPYNCPHGRPTMISMTKYEIEKKFKRIV
ncbi:DNA mismatch repair protein MutL [Acetitomaculum ruminis DSM 5522]|uniref:DNA mismatch repair protein MutL n=1 Tax=Acetitomaculum ruminis DSM 5522 TaxID=1120918 RepID=A0A1I0V4P9_9FIRM|nr:DNA mismatch repair endonuclease MutL [Acetitomaculum ruminis]SFA71251.1 DNA mismatch repair protein MutL [Acetitomaculum ruminis DSM 5522]